MICLEGQLAWVTGASRGIGKATAIALAKAGAEIIICARTINALDETASIIHKATKITPHLLAYDLSISDEIKRAFKEVKQKYNKLDIMVNNAGISDDALLGMITDQQIRNTLSTNTDAVICHTQFAARLMMKNKSGSIINISSIIGRVGNAGQSVYAASKAAVIGITQSAAKELASSTIRVNAVAPGFIDTDLTRCLSPSIFQERLNSVRMQRIGKPEDVANVILFLASDLASYITGQVIGVDGGMQV